MFESNQTGVRRKYAGRNIYGIADWRSPGLARRLMDVVVSPERRAQVTTEEVLAELGHLPGALLPVLHGVQARIGFIPSASIEIIARALQLSRAEVHGVVTYYHHFRSEPAGRVVIQICRAEACQARGSEALAAHAIAAIGCDFHETSADGSVTLEPVYCLGHCAVGPAIQIGEQQYARITSTRLDQLIGAARRESA